MLTNPGGARVERLAAEVGWSRKRLWSRFRTQTGLSPKHAAQLVRLDVRAFAGVTPTAVADGGKFGDGGVLDLIKTVGRQVVEDVDCFVGLVVEQFSEDRHVVVHLGFDELDRAENTIFILGQVEEFAQYGNGTGALRRGRQLRSYRCEPTRHMESARSHIITNQAFMLTPRRHSGFASTGKGRIMRKFQRAAVVAAAVAGLSALGAGVSFAGGYGAPPQVTAVANSQATAVAVGGGTAVANSQATAVAVGAPYAQPHYAPQPAPYGGGQYGDDCGPGQYGADYGQGQDGQGQYGQDQYGQGQYGGGQYGGGQYGGGQYGGR
ncbi:hypothetical protein [Streptomyces roseochromogenus]|nr:hypothetical protein [Streptomyces roseochromogenus]